VVVTALPFGATLSERGNVSSERKGIDGRSLISTTSVGVTTKLAAYAMALVKMRRVAAAAHSIFLDQIV
jgi:hypothetical protein